MPIPSDLVARNASASRAHQSAFTVPAEPLGLGGRAASDRSLCLPGDIFGFETGDEHTFSAEAITDCKITVIKRSAVVTLAARTLRSRGKCGR
jgi:CRP-like cAMP-binding protein